MEQEINCKHCGKPLKESQYARATLPNGNGLKKAQRLVCRNHPDCLKAETEMEIKSKIQSD